MFDSGVIPRAARVTVSLSQGRLREDCIQLCDCVFVPGFLKGCVFVNAFYGGLRS